MTFGTVTVIAAIVAFAAIVGYCVHQHFERKHLCRSVWANLDSAYENGYFQPGEHCDRMTAEELTTDLALYAEDFDGMYYTVDIEPYVRMWLQSRGLDR